MDNEAQIEFWNSDVGARWASNHEPLDGMWRLLGSPESRHWRCTNRRNSLKVSRYDAMVCGLACCWSIRRSVKKRSNSAGKSDVAFMMTTPASDAPAAGQPDLAVAGAQTGTSRCRICRRGQGTWTTPVIGVQCLHWLDTIVTASPLRNGDESDATAASPSLVKRLDQSGIAAYETSGELHRTTVASPSRKQRSGWAWQVEGVHRADAHTPLAPGVLSHATGPVGTCRTWRVGLSAIPAQDRHRRV